MARWTEQKCKKIAQKYKRRIDWKKGHCASYSAAYRNGWLEKCCSHMPPRSNRRITPTEYREWLAESRPGFVAVGDYESAHTAILHRCPVGHEFMSMPATLKRGHGCIHCAVNGFDESKPGMLYIITHFYPSEGDNLSKVLTNIGITNRTPWERYSKKDQETFDVIYVFESDDGAAVYELEQKLHDHFSYCRSDELLHLETKKGTRETFKVLPSDVIFMAQHYVGQLNTSRKAA